MSKPCVHGDVCRDYMRMFPKVKDCTGKEVTCILSQTCPFNCPHYEPKKGKAK